MSLCSKRKNKKRTSSGGSAGKQDSPPAQQKVKDGVALEEGEGRQELQCQNEIETVKEDTAKTTTVVQAKAATWSGETIEDPDTDDIDLLLMNNYQNYKLQKSRGGYLMDDGIEDVDGIEDLNGVDEDLLLTKDTDGDDEYEEESNLDGESDEDVDHLSAGKKSKRGWGWRVARIAVPLQFALISLFCVARLFEPQCCDVVNNFSMSFTPHLRYVRGPPPM